jgi:hypothetical protein
MTLHFRDIVQRDKFIALAKRHQLGGVIKPDGVNRWKVIVKAKPTQERNLTAAWSNMTTEFVDPDKHQRRLPLDDKPNFRDLTKPRRRITG